MELPKLKMYKDQEGHDMGYESKELSEWMKELDDGLFDLDLTMFDADEIKEFLPKEVKINEKELDENISTEKECPSCGYKW